MIMPAAAQDMRYSVPRRQCIQNTEKVTSEETKLHGNGLCALIGRPAGGLRRILRMNGR